MAPDKDRYADSPYDDGGMPIGTTYADYDNTEERRKNQVKTRPVKHPESINDIDYTPPETEQDVKFKESRKVDPAGFNGFVDTKGIVEDDSFLDETEDKKEVKK